MFGIEPVKEALNAGRSLEALWLSRGDQAATRSLLAVAKERGVRVQEVARAVLERKARTTKTQGVLAFVREGLPTYASIEEILLRAEEAGEAPLVVALDGVEDPRNLGAVIRSAHAFGAHGVVIPKHRAAGLTPSAVKASAGAAEHLPVARVTNIRTALSDFRDAGLEATAAMLDGVPLPQARLNGPRVLVLGSEGAGVRPSVAEACDQRVTIPLGRPFDSLNVSVAAGILLYATHVARGR